MLRRFLFATMVASAHCPAQGALPLSRGATPVAVPAANANSLQDGIWGQASWQGSAGTSVAFRIPAGHERLFLSFNTPSYTWSDSIAASGSCKQGGGWYHPTSYRIETSSNSTDGTDGTWTGKVTIADNKVSSRGHLFDFKDQAWVRLSIVAGSGPIDEIEIFDGGSGPTTSRSLQDDAWFFMGTSISSNAWKGAQPDSGFAGLVSARKPGRAPAAVRGGIPCINSTQAASDIAKVLENAGQCRFWGIEMGTNDAWGGSSANLAAFRTAMARIIDSALARGIVPHVARMIATDPNAANMGAKWQVHPGYLRVIDSFNQVKSKPGPDLYAWFLAHPEQLDADGVHPNAAGGASIQRLWAEVAANADVTTAVSPKVVAGKRVLARWVRGPSRTDAVRRIDGAACGTGTRLEIAR